MASLYSLESRPKQVEPSINGSIFSTAPIIPSNHTSCTTFHSFCWILRLTATHESMVLNNPQTSMGNNFTSSFYNIFIFPLSINPLSPSICIYKSVLDVLLLIQYYFSTVQCPYGNKDGQNWTVINPGQKLSFKQVTENIVTRLLGSIARNRYCVQKTIFEF